MISQGRLLMRTLGLVCTMCALLCLSACSKSGNADKIVGTWELAKAGEEMPSGSTFEFTKDGKMKINIKVGEQPVSVQGTYKVEGDTLSTSGKGTDGKEKTEKSKIKKLTDTTLILEDDKGKEVEFKKK